MQESAHPPLAARNCAAQQTIATDTRACNVLPCWRGGAGAALVAFAVQRAVSLSIERAAQEQIDAVRAFGLQLVAGLAVEHDLSLRPPAHTAGLVPCQRTAPQRHAVKRLPALVDLKLAALQRADHADANCVTFAG